MAQIAVNFKLTPDGVMEYEVSGATGQSCLRHLKPLVDALGGEQMIVAKPEMFVDAPVGLVHEAPQTIQSSI